MKTCVHLRQYLARFFSEQKMFQTKAVQEIKTHISYAITVVRKPCLDEAKWKCW